MKTAAVIAEYNPFHLGHKSQLADIKKYHGADACVVIMSGNYVQRGTPSVMDKFTRAKWALQHGADIVLELPTAYATGGAEQFAHGACAMLDRLGFVDILCFGSETGNTELITQTADFLAFPPAEYEHMIQKLLRQGYSYAAAREEALYPYFANEPAFADTVPLHKKNGDRRSDFHALLSAPNTILGIEYCKALKKLHSRIVPVPMERKGCGYHDSSLPADAAFASASAIRHHLFHTKDTAGIAPFVPQDVLRDLEKLPLMHENDYSSYLYYSIWGKSAEELCCFHEVSPDLAKRIKNCIPDFSSVTDFVTLLKTKQLAHARIQRALLHILLSIENTEPFLERNSLRLLGLRKEASHLLRRIPEECGVTVITKAADAYKKLPEKDWELFKKDMERSQLYGYTAHKKENGGNPYKEASISPVIL